MSAAESQATTGTAMRATLTARAESLGSQVRKEAAAQNRDDLVTVLDSIPEIGVDRPVRVIVAGSLKRGKSTLVNTLVGRPLLSPVGVDVTTACWLEIGYGEEQATALIANGELPGEPTRRPIDIAEVERYAALDCVAEPGTRGGGPSHFGSAQGFDTGGHTGSGRAEFRTLADHLDGSS